MSFWEVSVDHGLIAQERSNENVTFHASMDASLAMSATELHGMLKTLLLASMLGTLTLLSFLTPRIEPYPANLCLYFTGILALVSLHHHLAPRITAPFIERRWVRQFKCWYDEHEPESASDSSPDLEYLRTHDRRLDVIMAQLDLGERLTSGSWVQKADTLYPSIKDLGFFLRFWLRRSETGALGFGLAGILFYFGQHTLGMALGGATMVIGILLMGTQIFGWTRSSSESLRYLRIFHQKKDFFGDEGVIFAMVSEGTLRQFRGALDSGSTEKIRYWTERFLKELLAAIDPYRYPDVIENIVEPRLDEWYGKPLGATALDVITNFGRE